MGTRLGGEDHGPSGRRVWSQGGTAFILSALGASERLEAECYDAISIFESSQAAAESGLQGQVGRAVWRLLRLSRQEMPRLEWGRCQGLDGEVAGEKGQRGIC